MAFMRILARMMILSAARAFVSPSFHGPLGDHYNMYAIPRSTAYQILKNMEIDGLRKDVPRSILDEIHSCREMCRSDDTGAKRKNLFVSVIQETGKKVPEYAVIYRKSENVKEDDRRPTVYTIEAMLVNLEVCPNMSMSNVFDILDGFCKTYSGFLQVYPLKTWSNGRYFNGISLERSLERSAR